MSSWVSWANLREMFSYAYFKLKLLFRLGWGWGGGGGGGGGGVLFGLVRNKANLSPAKPSLLGLSLAIRGYP